MKKILLFIILFSTIGFSQIVRQPMLRDSLAEARSAVSASQATQDIIANQKYATQIQIAELEDSLAYERSLRIIIQKQIDTIFSRMGSVIATPVEPHTNLRGTGGIFQNVLFWHPSITADVDSTQIKVRLSSLTSNFTRVGVVGNGTDTTYTHTSLSSNTAWDYQVYAFKSNESSLASNTTTVKTIDTTVTNYETGGIAVIDAETNNLETEFSSTTVYAGNLFAIRDTAKLHGNYGFLSQKLTTGGLSDNTYGRYNFSLRDSIRVRGYFTFVPGGNFTANWHNVSFLTLYKNDENLANGRVNVTAGGSPYNMTRITLKDQNTDLTPAGWIPSDTIWVEVYYKKGTDSNATIQVFIDGVEKYSATDLTDTIQVNNVRVGFQFFNTSYLPVNTYAKIDDIKINDTTYIGAYSSSGGGTQSTEGIRYVSSTGNGAQNGADSANAFRPANMTAVAGDTLIFLGGTYTTAITIPFSGTAANPIVLKSSYRNGAVFYNIPSAAFFVNDSYLKFNGFKFLNCKRAFLLTSGSNVIYIDSMTATKGTDIGTLVAMDGWNASGRVTDIDSVFIRYNDCKTDSQTTNQTDLIYAQWAGNIFIQDNILDQLNTTGTQHNDCIQTANYIGNVIISNNKLTNTKLNSSQGMMLNVSVAGCTTFVYNNVVYTTGTSSSIYDYFYPDISGGKSYFINNTIVLYYNAPEAAFSLLADNVDSYIKNNIMYNEDRAAFEYIHCSPLRTGTAFADFDYNFYRGDNIGWSGSYQASAKTWAIWQSYGGGLCEANGIFDTTSNAPNFTDLANGDLTLGVGSSAIDAGGNLQTLVESFGLEWKTIEGVARDATPNMGAY